VEPLLAAFGGLVLGLFAGRSLGGARHASSGRLRLPASGRLRLDQLLRWIEEAPSGWLLVDAQDRLRQINPRAERQLRCAPGVLAAGDDLGRACPDPALRELVGDARRLGLRQRLEWELAGEEFELFALPADDGWVALVLLDRRSLEAQLEQQERWVSDVAHELRTPLTALLLVGDTLAAQAGPRQAPLVERLQRELLRLQELVGDLLELSRLENTLPPATPAAAVPLAPLVEQVWSGLRPLAEARAIRLEVRETGPEPGRVRADASRLHRVLLNLLDNALRFSPDGGCVEVAIEAGPRWCRLSVRDHGPGLSEEDLAHMFERFYRGDPARARSRRGGSGLGLAIVQQIAVTQGGRVRAGNHPGGGALLEWLLPVAG
jgi:two-component system phosphate regulon sensor histidine kinase PhoR